MVLATESDEKWLAVHFNNLIKASDLEEQIREEFQRAYVNAGRPSGMALFALRPIGGLGLYMTPQSIPFSATVLAMLHWSESTPLPHGPTQWLAGDESLKHYQ